MSDTNPIYPPVEVAISTVNSTDLAAHERKKEGDIMAVRLVGEWIGVGTKEISQRLWLRVEGLEHYESMHLIDLNHDPDPDGEIFEKRRYCIPLDRLKEVYPALDIARVRDTADAYQPFLTLDGDNYTFLTEENPLEVSGLVLDKYTGEYL